MRIKAGGPPPTELPPVADWEKELPHTPMDEVARYAAIALAWIFAMFFFGLLAGVITGVFQR